MKLFEIFGDIVLNDNGAEKKLDQVDKQAEQTGSRFEKFGQKMQGAGEKMSAFGGGMTKWVTGSASVAVGGLLALTNQIAGTADESIKASRKIGVSFQSYQELEYFLGQAGVEAGAMEKALGQLSITAGQAGEGNEKASQAFDRLGISIKDSSGEMKSADVLFEEALVGLEGIEDANTRNALAAELFGMKMARELAPAIESGGQAFEDAKVRAQELGIIMSEDAALSAEAYNDSMDDLKRSMTGMWRTIATNIIPVMNDHLIPLLKDKLVPMFIEGSQKVSDLVEWFMNLDGSTKKIIGIVALLVVGIGPLILIIGKTIAIIGTAITTVKALGVALTFLNANPIGAVIMGITAIIAIGVLLYKNWDTIKEKASQFGSFVKGKFDDLKNRTKTIFNDIKTAITKPIDEARAKIGETINKIKGFFTNLGDKLKITIPKPKLPRFSISGSFSLMPPSVPKLNITWNKNGAFFNKPAVFDTPYGLQGFGEAGPEVALPLRENVLSKLGGMIAKHSGNNGGLGDVIIQMNGDNYINSDYDIEEIGDKLGKEVRRKLGFSGVRS